MTPRSTPLADDPALAQRFQNALQLQQHNDLALANTLLFAIGHALGSDQPTIAAAITIAYDRAALGPLPDALIELLAPNPNPHPSTARQEPPTDP